MSHMTATVLGFLLLTAMCMQGVNVLEFGGYSLKLYHIVTLVILGLTLVHYGRAWAVPSFVFMAAIVVLIILSVFSSFKFGFSSKFWNYLFVLPIVLATYNLARALSRDQAEVMIRTSAWCVLSAVGIKLLANWTAVQTFIANPWNGHPAIPSYFGGGLNLEASWLALFGVFFKRGVSGALYLALTVGLSLVYASRAGLLISVLAALYVYVVEPRDRRLMSRVGVIVLLAAGGVWVMQAMQLPILARLGSIGDDRGSQGRLDMWQYIAGAFMDAPLIGAGAGNAVKHIEMWSSMTIGDENVHNYPAQVLLDFGAVGGLVVAGLVASVFRRALKLGFKCSFSAFILVYCVASLVQFSGGDAILAYIIGVYLWSPRWRSTNDGLRPQEVHVAS